MTYLAQLNPNSPSLNDIQTLAIEQLHHDFELFFDTVCLPNPLNAASRYAIQNGGKRVRPLLVLSSFLTLAQSIDTVQLDMVRRAMIAIEFIHGYSLIHDDLPCMDDDELRRGKPTCHVVYGEATALLAGDVLQSLAFEVLSTTIPTLSQLPQDDLKLLQILAPRARRMVAGQQLDLNGEAQNLSQQQLENIHKDKTGALIEAAVLMGGVCANATDEQMAQLLEYARTIGLAFQVQDDVLDVIADSQTLGKPTGSDEKLQKSTYVRLLGTVQASDYAKRLFDHARLSVAEFGAQNLLIQITDWLQKRNY